MTSTPLKEAITMLNQLAPFTTVDVSTTMLNLHSPSGVQQGVNSVISHFHITT